MYNLSKIMVNAWKNYRKFKDISFSEALHRAWISAKAETVNANRINALFGCNLIWGSHGDGAEYKARFFGRSQVQKIVTE